MIIKTASKNIKPAFKFILFCFLVSSVLLFCAKTITAINNLYVGTEHCQQCHQQQYRSFHKYSRMSSSYEGVMKLKDGITDYEYKKCIKCHTTGYGEPGGFVSEKRTPQFKNTGCESCHGPGSFHIKSRKKSDIQKKVTLKHCRKCHDNTVVKPFRFKPLKLNGAH